MIRYAATLGLLALSQASWADTRRFALIAGANDGGADRVRLQYAVTDAEAFADVLTDLGGVPASNQTLLVEPTTDVLREAIGSLGATVAVAEDRGMRTEVVVYYSGHSDEEGLLLGENRYPYVDLRADLQAIGADVQVVVLDSCASGAMVRTKGGVHRPAFLEDQTNDVEGTAYLMSASADESAQESDVVGASYFTHFLVSGLRGGADQTGDGRVTLDEAYAFASSETLRRTERTSVGAQHAIFDMNMKGHGGFVFTDLSQTTSSLVFDEALAGRLFVRNADGLLVAELSKATDRAVEVALDEGTYVVVLEQDAGKLEAEFTIREAEHLLVTDLQFSPVAIEQVVTRGAGGTAPDRVPPPAPVSELPGRHDPPIRAWSDADIQAGVLPTGNDTVFQFGALGARSGHNRGIQGASVFVTADALDGWQTSLWYADARRLRGAQTTFGFNLARGLSRGFQGGLVNVASAELGGMQMGLVNSARTLKGVQLGLVNQSDVARGVQVGLVNSGGDGRGFQLGLVNVADDYDGGAIGLITVHRNGYNHLFANVGSHNLVLLTATWGSRWVFTSVQFGMRGVFKTPTLTGGLGLHVPVVEDVYIDADLTAGAAYGDSGGGFLTRLRIQPGWAFSGRGGVQTGPELEWMSSDEGLLDGFALGWTVGVRM